MARPSREWIAGGLYHVFSRGSNRQAIFLNEGDYVEFDWLLGAALAAHGVDCLSIALMPNHWHALVRSPTAGLSSFMKRVNHRYALRFNHRWGRTAHLFENRFGAVPKGDEGKVLWTLRYIARNPVEAGLCATPYDARWTSFPAIAGLVGAPPHLRVDLVLAMFGGATDEARRRYVEYVV